MKLTNLLLTLTILSIPLGQLGKVPGLPEAVGIYAIDILVAITVFWWLIDSLAIKRSLKIPKLGFLILIFAFIALISLINGTQHLDSTQQALISGSYWLRWVIYAGIFFVAASTLHLRGVASPRTKSPGLLAIALTSASRGGFIRRLSVRGAQPAIVKPCTRRVWHLLVISGVVLALAGFVQLALFPDWQPFVKYGWDPHKNRLLSTFFDPNFTGIYLVLTINIIIASIISKPLGFRNSNPKGLAYLLALVICGFALILTFSRSAWLAMAASVVVWGIFKSRKLLVGAALVAFLAYFAIPRIQTRVSGGVDPDDSARLRFQSWSNTWEIAKQKPILGVGFNAFRYAQAREGYFHWQHPSGGHAGAGSDSSLLLVFATTGIIGLISYLSILGWVGYESQSEATGCWPRAVGRINQAKGQRLKARGEKEFAVLTLAILAALLANSLFINSLFYPPIMLFFWLVISSERPPTPLSR